VNPLIQTLEVYRRNEAHWALVGTHENGAHVQAAPFEAITLDLAPIWPGTAG
jgi:Uma2 family endonuclease